MPLEWPLASAPAQLKIYGFGLHVARTLEPMAALRPTLEELMWSEFLGVAMQNMGGPELRSFILISDPFKRRGGDLLFRPPLLRTPGR